VHGARDSSSVILLHVHSKVFTIIYTNCPGNVCPGKWLSGKRLVREIIDELGYAVVRETSFRETPCPGNACPGKWLSGTRPLPPPPRHALPLTRSGSGSMIRIVPDLWSGSPPKLNRLINCSLPTFPEISCKSVQKFLAQTCQQTDKQTTITYPPWRR